MPRPSILWLLFFVGCSSIEQALVYQPRPGDQPYQAPPPPIQDIELTLADGTKVHARWAPHPHSQGAMLFCHGNGGNVEQWGGPVRKLWQELETSVLIFDYPGYGHSTGQPSEAGCYAAAEAAYRWLIDTQRVPPERIVLYGESLGGAVAVELASRQPHRALALVRTFTSVPDVGDDQMPLLPASLLMTNRFDSLSRIPTCRAPIFIANSEADRLIPLRHGQRLHAACTAPAEFCLLRGLGHHDPLPTGFYAALRQFLDAKAPMTRS